MQCYNVIVLYFCYWCSCLKPLTYVYIYKYIFILVIALSCDSYFLEILLSIYINYNFFVCCYYGNRNLFFWFILWMSKRWPKSKKRLVKSIYLIVYKCLSTYLKQHDFESVCKWSLDVYFFQTAWLYINYITI